MLRPVSSGASFPAIEFETWRARALPGGPPASPLSTLEGVAVPPLGPPSTPVRPLPTRAPGATTVIVRAPATTPSATPPWLDGGVDGVWLACGATQPASPEFVAAWRRHVPGALPLLVDGGATPESVLALANVQVWIDPCSAHASDGPPLQPLIARWLAQPEAWTWVCDGAAWHDAGASAVDEVAIAIAGLLVALRSRERAGLSPTPPTGSWALRLGLGGTLLLDVAKLRATRALAQAVLVHAGDAAAAPRLFARSARRTRTPEDLDTNLVRAALEAFAGHTGGADALLLEPHDRRPASADDAARWARNTGVLLERECHLGRVADPWAGAWAIEAATTAIAEAAWTRVRAIEAAGGLADAEVAAGVRRDVAATAGARIDALRRGELSLVGATRHRPPQPCADPPPPEPGVLTLAQHAAGGGDR